MEDREKWELKKALLVEQQRRIMMEYQLNQSAMKEVDEKLKILMQTNPPTDLPPELEKEKVNEQ